MTALETRQVRLEPSPSKLNPFARRPVGHSVLESSSFARTTILPTLQSPVKAPLVAVTDTQTSDASAAVPSTPAGNIAERADEAAKGSAARPKQASRLLWRGGLEIGKDGWRLDGESFVVLATCESISSMSSMRFLSTVLSSSGSTQILTAVGITFFATLSFPSTPAAQAVNPFDSTPIHSAQADIPTATGSPFALPSADTDLCLSLESMRGRKYLQIRGVEDIDDEDIADYNGDASVQM